MRTIINGLKNIVILLIIRIFGNDMVEKDNDGYNNC